MSYLPASADSLGCSCQHLGCSCAPGELGDTIVGTALNMAKALTLRAEVNRFPGVSVPTSGMMDDALAAAALGIMYQRLVDSRAAYPNDRGLNTLIYNLEQARLPANAVAYTNQHIDEILATVQEIGNVKKLPVARPISGSAAGGPGLGATGKIALVAAGLGLLFFASRSA